MSIGRVFCLVTVLMLGGSLFGFPGFAQQSASDTGATKAGAETRTVGVILPKAAPIKVRTPA